MLSFSFAVLPGSFEFFISGGEDGGVARGDAVGWGDVAECGVEAHGAVMVNEAADDAVGVLKSERGSGADGIVFESAVEALEFTVAFRVVRRAEDVCGLPEADKLFEVLGHELGAVVGDEANKEKDCQGERADAPEQKEADN